MLETDNLLEALLAESDSDDEEKAEPCAVLYGLDTDKLRAVLRCLDDAEIKAASEEAAKFARQHPSPIENSAVTPLSFGLATLMRCLAPSITRLPGSLVDFEKFINKKKLWSVYSLEFLVCARLLLCCLKLDFSILKQSDNFSEWRDAYVESVKLGLKNPHHYYKGGKNARLVFVLINAFQIASNGLAAERVDVDSDTQKESFHLSGRLRY